MESNKVADEIRMKLLGRIKCPHYGEEQEAPKPIAKIPGTTWIRNCNKCGHMLLRSEKEPIINKEKVTI